MLDRDAIAAYLPHAGRMCLLDRALAWDQKTIRCAAISHRDAENPLRNMAGLDTLAGVEYAAQAAALHGAIISNARAPRSGVLAALKNVTAHQKWLHQIAGDIFIDTTLLHVDPAGGIFSFAVSSQEGMLLEGQFTLMYVASPQKET